MIQKDIFTRHNRLRKNLCLLLFRVLKHFEEGQGDKKEMYQYYLKSSCKMNIMIIVIATMLETETNFQLLIRFVKPRYIAAILFSLSIIVAFILHTKKKNIYNTISVKIKVKEKRNV